jgi:hypothetical protein
MELNGYVARWRGGTYEASAAAEHGRLQIRLYRATHADGFTEVAGDRFMRTVPPEDLDGLTYVHATCRWRDAPFSVLARDPSDRLHLEYAGDRPPVAEELGLTEVEHRVYRVWVPFDEVDRIDAIEIPLL